MKSLLLDAVLVCAGLLAIRRVPEHGSPVPAILICLGAAAVVFAISLPPVLFEDFGDSYYLAGKAVLDPLVALPLIGPDVDAEGFGFVNLPIVAYLFAPLGALPEPVAAGIFTAVGLATTVGAWLLLSRLAGLEGRRRWLLLFLFAANGPLHNSFREGNSTQMVLFALAGALYLLRAQRRAAAGCLLGAAAVIKLPLLVFGVYFVLRRNWRSAFGFGTVLAAAALLSLAGFGWSLHREWLEHSVLQYSSHPIGAWNVQSIQAFLVRLDRPSDILFDFWTARSPDLPRRLAAFTLLGLLCGATVQACARGRAAVAARADAAAAAPVSSRELEFLLVLTLAIVTSPLSWSHYYALLLIPIAFFLGPDFPIARGAWLHRLAWLGILLTTPVVLALSFSNPTLMTLYTSFGVSHVLLGGLIWFGLLARARVLSVGDPAAPQPRRGLGTPWIDRRVARDAGQ